MSFARHTFITAATALVLGWMPAAWALQGQEAVQIMVRHGYLAPHGLEKQFGFWTAKAASPAGQRVDLLVADADGSLTAIHKADLGSKLPGARQVAERLRSLGYGVIHELEFDDGFWEAEVRQSWRSEKVELILHPVTLDVLNQTGHGGSERALPAAEIARRLQQAGYTRVHDLEFDDGRWEAEAVNAQGQRVELYINARTGAVEREKFDD